MDDKSTGYWFLAYCDYVNGCEFTSWHEFLYYVAERKPEWIQRITDNIFICYAYFRSVSE